MPDASSADTSLTDLLEAGAVQRTTVVMQRVSAFCGVLLILSGVLTLASWMSDMAMLTSLRPEYVPIEPSTATAFLLLGHVLVLCGYVRMSRLGRCSAFVSTFVVLVGSLVVLVQFFLEQSLNVSLNIERYFSLVLLAKDVARMSPFTAMNFAFASTALLLLLPTAEKYHRRVGDLALLASTISLVMLLGYLYGTPLLYNGRVPPMALLTCIEFIVLGIGLMAAVGPKHFPMRTLMGDAVRPRLLRIFLPFSIASVLLFGLLYEYIQRFFISSFGGSFLLSTLAFAVLMGVAVFMLIQVVSNRIDRVSKERLMAEEASLRLAAIVESSGDAIVGLALDGTVTSWNRGADEIFGYTAAEMKGQPIAKIYPPSRQPDIADMLKRVKSGARIASVETEHVRKDGKRINVMVSLSPVKDATDTVIAASAIVRDISEQRMNERVLRDNFTRLATLIEHLPVGVIVEDESRQILHINGKFCSLFGIRESPSMFVSQPSAPLYDRCMTAMLRGSQLHNFFQKDNGSELTPQFSEPLYLADGRVFECDYMPVMVDATYRGCLRQFRDSTERRRADESKSNFILLASHQLRTPLTAVRLALETLNSGAVGSLNDRQQTVVRQSIEYGTHMAETVRTLLSVSRIETGTVNPVSAVFNLQPMLQTVVGEYHTVCADKEQEIYMACPPEVTLNTDQNLLREVIYSLVSNAINYTPAKGKIGVTASKEPDGSVKIAISDTGFGIPLKEQDRVFQKFFRAENALHKKTNGTGIGLYLAHSLVTLLGGKISFQSQENQGTTFTILFPPPKPNE